jgi:F0F1-type ATP synthase epsilon subunit
MSSEPTMQVRVHAPFRVYFDGPAVSLSAVNETGPFDILPHHKNFMTLLQPCELTIRILDKPNFTLKVTRGVMHVKADQVTVFLDV